MGCAQGCDTGGANQAPPEGIDRAASSRFGILVVILVAMIFLVDRFEVSTLVALIMSPGMLMSLAPLEKALRSYGFSRTRESRVVIVKE